MSSWLFNFDRSISRIVRISTDAYAQENSAQEQRSLRRRQAQPKKDKQRAGGTIEPLSDNFIRAQALAERRGEPRQDQAPDCSGGDECEAQREKRRNFQI